MAWTLYFEVGCINGTSFSTEDCYRKTVQLPRLDRKHGMSSLCLYTHVHTHCCDAANQWHWKGDVTEKMLPARLFLASFVSGFYLCDKSVYRVLKSPNRGEGCLNFRRNK